MRTGRDPGHKDAPHEQDGLVADGQTSNDVARLLEAFHLPVGRVPIAAEGHDRRRPGHGARGSQSSAQHLRHRTHEAVAVVGMLGPFDALQELEPQAQSGFGFEIFVQVRLGEQEQSFAVDAFHSEVLDKRLRRAEPREKSSYLFAGPRVGVVGQPRGRIVEGAAPTPLLRRRRRRRDATRRAVSRASVRHCLSVLLLLHPLAGAPMGRSLCAALPRPARRLWRGAAASARHPHAVDAPCTHLYAQRVRCQPAIFLVPYWTLAFLGVLLFRGQAQLWLS